ncbi:MAG TPA: molybdenum cofactor guanylyltransferase [Acidimicrobiales bacterium]|nr:molybdenum cofactor guanylyltransferase [Acidimicrobiales bacterium]
MVHRPGFRRRPPPGPPTFGAAVLCGGASRRMGQDKAFLVVEGEAMVVRVARALRGAGAGEVVAVGGDAAGLRGLGLAHLPDDHPGDGPLGGVLTALRLVGAGSGPPSGGGPLGADGWTDGPAGRPPGPAAQPRRDGGPADARAGAGDELVLVVACDLLHPSAEALAATVGALAPELDADVAVPVAGGRRQWDHAAWRRTALAPLRDRFAAGERGLGRAVATAGLGVVAVEGLAGPALADADEPADLPPP